MSRYNKLIGLVLLIALSMFLTSCSDDDSSVGIETLEPGLQWAAVNPGTESYLIDVAWSEERSQFAAVGFNGIILTSDDGLTWSEQTSPISCALFGIIWAHNQFIAVGDSGTLLVSPNGQTWSTVNMDTDEIGTRFLYGITSSESKSIVVGQSGTILISNDGESWSLADSIAVLTNLYSVTWSPELSLFVAVGGAGYIVTSPNGNSWTHQITETSTTLYDVIWAEDKFIAVGQNGIILTSVNGQHWISKESRIGGYLYDIAWSGDEFVAVGQNGLILSSPDSDIWTLRGYPFPSHLRSITWSSEVQRFVAVGLYGTILTSPDGISWTTRVDGNDIDLYAVTCLPAESDAVCLAVGSNSTILISRDDGRNWGMALSGTDNTLRGVACRAGNGDTIYVAVGDSILTSTDAKTWTGCNPTDNDLESIAASETQFVAVGRSGTILYSSDGGTWSEPVEHVTSEHLYGITWDSTQFAAVGNNGAVVTSTDDGITWSLQNVGNLTDSLRSIVWVDTMFIAVGLNGVILTSLDVSDWSESEWLTEAENKSELKDVASSGDRYVAVGVDYKIVSSDDGLNWYTIVSSSDGLLGGVVWTGDCFITVGEGAAIFTSP